MVPVCSVLRCRADLNNLYAHLRKACNHPLLFWAKKNSGLPSLSSLFPKAAAASLAAPSAASRAAVASGSDEEEGNLFYDQHLLSGSNKMIALHQVVSFCIERMEKLVIFSHSTKTLDLAEDFLLESGIRPARLDGETPEADRRAAIEAFLRPPQVGWTPATAATASAAGAAVECLLGN